MSIEAILKAAEYIERRERGKRRGFAVFSLHLTATMSHSSAKLVVCCTEFWWVYYVFAEAEHGYAMIRPDFVDNISSRRKIASTSAKRSQQSASVGVR